ncbi:MAG TPA: DsrE family protein [Steroidobacteraceae bacterium]|nr:DsrE family protein [Steroidobacteraceae bacterium]
MKKNYLIIVSEDPLEFPATRRAGDLALQLKQCGHEVALFLVQNGVLASRANASADGLSPIFASAIEVLADDFSLRERGIEFNELRAGVAPAPIDTVVSRLAAGWNTLWS